MNPSDDRELEQLLQHTFAQQATPAGRPSMSDVRRRAHRRRQRRAAGTVAAAAVVGVGGFAVVAQRGGSSNGAADQPLSPTSTTEVDAATGTTICLDPAGVPVTAPGWDPSGVTTTTIGPGGDPAYEPCRTEPFQPSIVYRCQGEPTGSDGEWTFYSYCEAVADPNDPTGQYTTTTILDATTTTSTWPGGLDAAGVPIETSTTELSGTTSTALDG